MFRTTLLSLALLIGLPVFAQDALPAADQDNFPARTEWLAKWQNSLEYTLETLDLLQEGDLAFAPTEGQMTMREQMHHIATNIYFLTSRYLDTTSTIDIAAVREAMVPEADKTAIANTLRDAFTYAAAACSALPESGWDAPVPDFFAGPKSKRTILNLLQDHATHHRAQVLVYLRLLEYQPPSYRGW